MNAFRLTMTVGLALVLSFPVVHVRAEKRGLDAETLVQLKRISSPRVSPDGQTLLYSLRETDMENDKGVRKTWRMNLATGKTSPVFSGDDKGRALQWSADGKLLYFLRDVDGAAQLFSMQDKGGKAQQMTSIAGGVGDYKLTPDASYIVFSASVYSDCSTLQCSLERDKKKANRKDTAQVYDKLFVRHWDSWKDGKISRLYSLALTAHGVSTAEPVLLSQIVADVPSKPWGGAEDFNIAPDGKSVVFSARRSDRTEPWSTNFDLYWVGINGEGLVNLTAANKAWDSAAIFARDAKTLYYTAMKRPGFEADRFAVMAMDLATGKKREIAPDWDRSAGQLVLSDDGKKLFTTASDMGRKRLFSIDIDSGQVVALTRDGSAGGFVQVGNELIVSMDDLSHPADFWFVPINGKGNSRQITHVNADLLDNIQWGEYEQFSFKGANNEDVRGYIMKPWNYQAGKQYPVAFLIHGGPQGSFGDHFHYRWNPQTYAGMGFAAVFIDFHGSTGYGQSFTDAISQDWGGKPLEDLKKGWQYVLHHYDFLDADRACALGASYGGYMVNWIAGNWKKPWQCLVNHDGVFDQRMMYYSTEELWFIEWENGGVYWENANTFEKYNPVNYVQNWTVPMLVVQGELDYRIPVTQSLGTFTALQRQGVPSKLLYFPDENHWVLKPHNSIRWHREVGDWLKQWTKAKN